ERDLAAEFARGLGPTPGDALEREAYEAWIANVCARVESHRSEGWLARAHQRWPGDWSHALYERLRYVAPFLDAMESSMSMLRMADARHRSANQSADLRALEDRVRLYDDRLDE